MRFLLFTFVFLFAFDVYAQTQYAGLSSTIPQRIHNKALELENCAITCDEPRRTNSRNALNFLTSQFDGINFDIANNAGSTDRLLIGDALNVLSDASILQADQIAENGVADSNIVNANRQARENAQDVVGLTGRNITNSQSRQQAINGLNGEGLFLEETVRRIFEALRNIVFEQIYPNIGSLVFYTYTLMLTLWFVSVFVRMMFGGKISWGSFAFTIVSFLIIQSLVFGDFELFIAWFADPAIKTSFGLASWFVSPSENHLEGIITSNVNTNSVLGFLSLIEIQWIRIIDISQTLWYNLTSGGVLEIVGRIIVGAAAWAGLVVSFSFTLTMFAFQIIYSILAGFLILAIAPIYLLFFPFPQTRGLFMTWIKAFANYLLIPVIGSVAISLCVFSVEHVIIDLENSLSNGSPIEEFEWSKYWALFIISMINGFVATRIGSLAALLVGGGPSTDLGRDIMGSLSIVSAGVAGAVATTAFALKNMPQGMHGAADGIADSISEASGVDA